MTAVHSSQRHSRQRPCKICGGWDGLERGVGKRCGGYLGHDGKYEHCSREELAGSLEVENGGTYAHKLEGECKCGISHGPSVSHETSETVYDYFDGDGVLRFQVVRSVGKDGKKTFRQRRPDGRGGHVWNMQGVERCLYRWPQLAKSGAATVWLVEGEKDADTGARLGLETTTTPGGEGGCRAIKSAALAPLKGRTVVILRDADEAGERYANMLRSKLEGVAASVRIVVCGGGHKDLSDWVAAGATREDVERLALAVAEEKPRPVLKLLDGGRKPLALQRDDNQKPLKIAANVAVLLATHPAWKGGPRFDEFRRESFWPENAVLGGSRCLEDSDAAEIQAWLLAQDFTERVDAGLEVVWAGIELAAARNKYDSLVEHVKALPEWDRTERSLVSYLGCDGSDVERAVCRRWLIGAMARVFRPGESFGGCLVLEGAQESYKNRGMEALYTPDYVTLLGGNKIGSREADMLTDAYWLVHDDEFSQSPGAIDALKTFLAKPINDYRAPYGRNILHRPRRCAFAASTNRVTYLEDEENRRFWPIKVKGRLNVDGLARDREQIWAEILVAYRSGEPWYVSPDDPIRQALREEQAARVTRDLMTDAVEAVLEMHFAGLDCITTHQIAEKLTIESTKRDRGLEMRLGRILRDLKWVPGKVYAFGKRTSGYLRPKG